MTNYNQIKKHLKKLENKEKAKILQGFFKTGPGQYAENDVFLGVIVPKQREIAKIFKKTPHNDLRKLLKSKIHEERLTALFIMLLQYRHGDQKQKKKIFNMYLKNIKNINNWDLVDATAAKIIGNYLSDKQRGVLYKLAKSKRLWERRISIVATFEFIKNNDFQETIKISKILLNDDHNLIHKAVGWMLREMGKKNKKELLKFLDKNHTKMKRTTLRYSLEKMTEKKRKYYLYLKK